MNAQTMGRSILPILGAGVFLWPRRRPYAADQHFEKHFPVQGPSGRLHP